jgi:ParB/RepB/Spo0J family partition protein
MTITDLPTTDIPDPDTVEPAPVDADTFTTDAKDVADDVDHLDADTPEYDDDTPPDERATVESAGEGDVPALCWLALDVLRPHPDNPRTSLGDLTELSRSIRAQGILEPLLVLPANEHGEHLLIAGHRRHAAAVKAGTIATVPAVVRSMTPVEVIEAMLSENVNRSDLTISEEVKAIERLMTLDTGVTPAKLCKRIGRSKAWIKARMAVTVLPAKWRAALDAGDFTLAAGEAAAAVADLGPDHLDAVCERLDGHTWGDPGRVVDQYRADLRRVDAYQQAVTRARNNRRNKVVFTSDDRPPAAAKPLGELFDGDGTKAHASEPCHAVMVERLTYSDGHTTYPICTNPRRHSTKQVGTPEGSDIASDRGPSRPRQTDDYKARRQGRVARTDHARATFARTRGGISQTDLTRVAQRALIHAAHHEAIVYAADVLGIDGGVRVTAEDLLADVTTPAGLARVAGAVALGIAEAGIYYASSSEPCRDYLDLLTRTGFEPDAWTADRLARNTELDQLPTDDSDTEDDDDDADDADPAQDEEDEEDEDDSPHDDVSPSEDPDHADDVFDLDDTSAG